jgi:hypothetical protein
MRAHLNPFIQARLIHMRGEDLRVWLPAVGLLVRHIALVITAIIILSVFGDRSEAEKVAAMLLAALLLLGVILSVVIEIRRRQAISKL